MKPLLIIPPAPARWPALQDLLQGQGASRLADVEQRMVKGVPGAQDAYAVIGDPGQVLASASINKCGDVGLLGHVFTRPEQRGRGHARRVTEAVLSWFDMTGGRWLYLSTTAELDEGMYWKFGFAPLHRAAWAPFDRLTMLRIGIGVEREPLDDAAGATELRAITRADWAAMVALLQYREGPDPRVPIAESAVTAEVFTLDLLSHLERGSCQIRGVFRGSRLTALGTLATEGDGGRTYGMLVPHAGTPPELRAAILQIAAERGYSQVDFPMETLAVPPAAASPVASEPSTPNP